MMKDIKNTDNINVNKLNNFEELEVLRLYGYDILINRFEPLFRDYISTQLLSNYGDDWRNQIPNGVIDDIEKKIKRDSSDLPIEEIFQETYLWHLKGIVIFKNNFKFLKNLIADLRKNSFIEVMDELNKIRRKIAHARENFYLVDLETLIIDIKFLIRGKDGKDFIDYINNEKYKNSKDLKSIRLEDEKFICLNNLPSADYDLDGGFVGRTKEIEEIKRLIFSNLDRIVTITGAGGVGKTALALEIAKEIIEDSKNPFNALLWFSAKEKKLTSGGIELIHADIKNIEQLIKKTIEIIDRDCLYKYEEGNVPLENYIEFIYSKFENNNYLLIIDNLESVLDNAPIINFIEDLPGKILITSRRGLGKLERPYPLKDMNINEAIRLFKKIARARNLNQLVALKNDRIKKLVKRVKCYPLVIKWSIGQIALGKGIKTAFGQIYVGVSDIAQFSFKNIFTMLSDDAKLCLYSIIVWDKPVSIEMIKSLTDLDDDKLDESIKELFIASFLYFEDYNTKYDVLSLTKGFIESELNNNEAIRTTLQAKKYHLSQLIEADEALKSSRYSLPVSLNIKTPEEKIAFKYVKKAKEVLLLKKNFKMVVDLFEKAVNLAPNLAYIYEEYSKFEFYNRGNHNKAIKLAEIGIKCEPENFHVYLNLAICFRKTANSKGAETNLIKALELNPNCMHCMNELGRVYTYEGKYEQAEKQLKLTEEKEHKHYGNLRNRMCMITKTFIIDNYRRWAEQDIRNKNYTSAKGKLKTSESLVNKVLETEPDDRVIYHTCREVYYTFGLLYKHKKNFMESLAYFYKAIGKIAGSQNEGNKRNIFARSYYQIINIKEMMGILSKNEILILIDKGLAECETKSNWFKKLKRLKSYYINLSEKRTEGIIKYFNAERKFGKIQSQDNDVIFFPSGFLEYLSPSSLVGSEGRNVSFYIKKNNNEKFKNDVAVNIIFIQE